MQSHHRLFAVIPAAGVSRRMGQPKLLLQLAGKTVLARLLEALSFVGVEDRVVVLRNDDEALCAEATAAGASVVQPPVPPPDMRQSTEYALEYIEQRHSPAPDDGWLLLPADHPVLARSVIETLIERWNRQSDLILVPTCQGRRGHPAFFRWRLIEEIRRIPRGAGLNQLLKSHRDAVTELPVEDDAVLLDLDTPADYEKLRRRFSEG